MKRFKTGLAIFIFALAISGCDTKTNEKTEAAADSPAVETPATNELNSDQSALLTTILGAEQAEGTVLRGISFGDPVSKIKASENFEMFEETADHLGYTAETPQLETIDVQYFLTPDKKVNRITIDVYLNSPEATKQLWNAGKNYFTKRYDAPKEEPNQVTWNKKSVRVNMEDVSKGKDFGLKFQFVPTDKNVLAAK
ncbi:hypothetical protein MUK70_26825 [Dyadobacter chenwenxiniae]|uniref:Lipoprotein n=1 Tax=Dyadobacter chenwenxiniae TaxID=2906456 RepID=A0A9X1TGR9_9BACT|nr:hypothetical protein [Dyadobacter chenwenxiniae]MCF0063894.1 hypothetical protein [Dyadobacter chenwenxiniae]UON82626.1 hypothetical protein MUK70_26825 [Dyadobacter chenwenxiniae]